MSTESPIVVLAGGVGAARFLEGLVREVPAEDVVAIVNVGDDLEWAGLHVSPDLDTVTYTLADEVNPETGWGLRDETTTVLARLASLGGPDWFQIGDHDLATHLYRTGRLADGATLSEITAELALALGVPCAIRPVTDDRLRTIVETEAGEIPFQEYFVRRRAEDAVRGLRYEGADSAKAAPGVYDALTHARAVIVAPSNPFLSIEPVLAVQGVRDCLLATAAPIAAISPIIGGKAVKGPAAAILGSLGHDVSALGIARLYADLVDLFVLDLEDTGLEAEIERELGLRCLVTPTLMRGVPEKRALARATLDALNELITVA